MRVGLDPEFQTKPFTPYSNTEPAPPGYYQRQEQEGKAIPPYLAEFLDVLDNIEREQGTKVQYQSPTWWIAYNAYIQGLIDGTREAK